MIIGGGFTQREKQFESGVKAWTALVLLAMTAWCVSPAHAGLVFFANNPAGFAAAMSGNTLIGTETFEESTVAPPGAVTVFNDPLTQGVPNGPFPTGLIQPMTLQSNISGGAAVTPNPRGSLGLNAFAAPFSGATSDGVVAGFEDSLDWIFAGPTQVAGVGLNTLSVLGPSTLEIEVYDLSNALLGSTTITGDPAGTNFLGIQATAGDLIGRINFFALGEFGEGGDNAMLFRVGAAPPPSGVPEPASLGLLGIGVAALVLSRRRRVA